MKEIKDGFWYRFGKGGMDSVTDDAENNMVVTSSMRSVDNIVNENVARKETGWSGSSGLYLYVVNTSVSAQSESVDSFFATLNVGGNGHRCDDCA